MNKIVIAVAISLFTGLAVGGFMIGASQPEPDVASRVSPGNYFDPSAATDDRIRALEAAVAEERNARQLLEEEVQFLYSDIERLRDQGQDTVEQLAVTARQDDEILQERRRRLRFVSSAERRTNLLIDAGFSASRAEWIVKRESELQMEAMQAQFDARQSGAQIDWNNARLNPDAALRAEIGDVEYEQYLQASDRSTAVVISAVLESSPGQRAGLQPGDQIVAYGGQRVFSTSELNQQIYSGAAGESVAVDFMRDGVRMQVVLPRGPIGISSARMRRGR